MHIAIHSMQNECSEYNSGKVLVWRLRWNSVWSDLCKIDLCSDPYDHDLVEQLVSVFSGILSRDHLLGIQMCLMS